MVLVDPNKVDISLLPSLPFEERKYLPFYPAIYFVVAGEEKILVYIGCSQSLQKRWIMHSHRYAFEQMTNVLIYWYVLQDTSDIYAIEKAFIAFWKPRLNGPSEAYIQDRLRRSGKKLLQGHRPYGLVLLPEDADWAKAQPEGLSGLVRALLAAERQRRASSETPRPSRRHAQD